MQAAALQCQGTAARFSGRRIAVVIPRAGEEEGQGCADEIAEELAGEPTVRVGVFAWRQGINAEGAIRNALEQVPSASLLSAR